MYNRLTRAAVCCVMALLFVEVRSATCRGEILYDNLQDDVHPFEYQAIRGADLNWTADGLSVVTPDDVGQVSINTEEGELGEADSWSVRARFTINEELGLGLAGVVVEGTSNSRWAGIFTNSNEFAVGQDFSPEARTISGGQVLGKPFVVQLDFSADELTGYLWRPDSPTSVTVLKRRGSYSRSPGSPRFGMNGSGSTFQAVWISRSHLPLPTGFEELGDLDGNEILDVHDIDLLAAQIRGPGLEAFDLNGDGVVDLADQDTLVQSYLGTKLGDANLDGQVQFSDFLALSEGYGKTTGWSQGDFNANGRTDFADFLVLSANFDVTGGAALSVPEPSYTPCWAWVLAGWVMTRGRCLSRRLE